MQPGIPCTNIYLHEEIPNGHSSVWTWQKIHSPGCKTFSPNATNPAKDQMWELLKSEARHSQGEPAMDRVINRARDQHTEISTDLGKSTVLMTVTVLWCYSDSITESEVPSCSQTIYVAWKLFLPAAAALTSKKAPQCLFCCNTTILLVRHNHSYSGLTCTASSLWQSIILPSTSDISLLHLD